MKGKEKDKSFKYIASYHVIALLETWCLNESDYEEMKQVLPGYTLFEKCSVKLNRKGRSSGGVLVLIKNDVVEYFTELQLKFQHGLSFLVNEQLNGLRLQLRLRIYLKSKLHCLFS